jgi:hypothetical protein
MTCIRPVRRLPLVYARATLLGAGECHVWPSRLNDAMVIADAELISAQAWFVCVIVCVRCTLMLYFGSGGSGLLGGGPGQGGS